MEFIETQELENREKGNEDTVTTRWKERKYKKYGCENISKPLIIF